MVREFQNQTLIASLILSLLQSLYVKEQDWVYLFATGLLKKMGGEIEVQSVVDKGTCFKIKFPFNKS